MTRDGVVFLHGIFRSARSMEPLKRYVEGYGFRTLNVNYPSTRRTLDELALHVTPAVADFSAHLSGRVHFVGYSMGGLVIRHLLSHYRPENLGRVVMIGTPNQGSEVADFLQRWWLYRKLYGPAGQELTTHYAPSLAGGVANYELGILAGNRTSDPLCNYLIGAPNDGKVAVERTKLPGMKAHRVLKAGHVFFPLNQYAWEHTVQFIRTGDFPDAHRA